LNFLDVIRNNVGRMAALVSDLSDLNRVESGRMKLELGMFSVYEVVQDAVKSLGPNIAQKNQTLQVEVADGLPEVYADPQRVSQIFTNLLNNAWKYTPEQGSIRVKAWLSQPDGLVEQMLRIEVVDTGIGISEEDQQQLFTPFFRSEALAVREEQGWGLGLSVARSLVELMGGEIGVVSELEKGSNFWFTLPLQPEEQEIDTPS
jgi:signal transduction histidine kinase